MSQEQGFLPAVIKGKIKEKGEHDMLFLSALELVQMCQKHGILIGTDCVIHFCDEQGTWHETCRDGYGTDAECRRDPKIITGVIKGRNYILFKGINCL